MTEHGTMRPKKFRLAAESFKHIAVGYGACYATDRITVDGAAVGYCYREATDLEADSGWRFLAGDESQEYADDPDNWALYDINTIANYDTRIITLLDAPIGSKFESDEAGRLSEVRER